MRPRPPNGHPDATFSRQLPRPADQQYLGLLGPVIRAQVGDTVKVTFRNNCSFPASIHPHGVFYNKKGDSIATSATTSVLECWPGTRFFPETRRRTCLISSVTVRDHPRSHRITQPTSACVGKVEDMELDVTVRRHGQLTMVHPRGSLTLPTATELRRVLVRELLDHGRVVVDLDGFRLGPQASWVMIFPTVLAECGGWPAAKIALCRPDAEMTEALATGGVSTVVPVYHLQLEAKAAIDRRPDVVRMRTELPGNVRAPATARQLIRDLCPQWQVDHDLQETAQVVVSELVDVAIGPAPSRAELILERGPLGLQLAVQDASSTPPVAHPADPLPAGLGLEMLGNLTTAWGVHVAPDGRTAWAMINN